ncbi:fimbria/pilus outer membrane usher protein [Acinetobacter schindleri]|uniref:fimbria/pilus outer membrane usher protein n=1 Tax=Acinetobacter schindleri TaxID=108981 RepID=UPI00142D782D|nr:fimbria/pilus outer membrane usher protein [Acinetobacter schindleri]
MLQISKSWKTGWRCVLSSTILTFSSPALAYSPLESVTVHAVYHEQLPDRYRLLVETEQDIAFHLLSNPLSDQVIIELTGIDAHNLASILAEKIPKNHELIRYIDIQNDKAVTRLQLTLNDRRKVNVFKLAPDSTHKYRLGLDLLPMVLGESFTEKQVQILEQSEPLSAVTPLKDEATSVDHLTEKSQNNKFNEFWLETTLNKQLQHSTVLALQDTNDQILLAEQDLLSLKLILPKTVTVDYQGERFYYLQDLGIQSQIDLRRSTLDLQAPANLFKTTELSGSKWQQKTLSSSVGAFFNYDLSMTQNNSDDEIRTSGLFEVGAFNRWGSGSANFLAQHNQTGESPEWIRLDTQWRKDNPQTMHTLTLGDTFSRGTGWSGGVRFGGFQWGTNYSTQPEFVTLPLMSVAGEAALPSTVDLYVNDALRLQREVPPGPFTIDEIPTITGSGQTKLIVRDILGREQVITKDFYSSQKLLRKGLDEYSVELGAIREDYGRSSSNYGQMMAAMTWRRGLNDRFTLEGHAQALAKQGMIGVGTHSLLPFGGALSLAAATSYTDRQQGELYTLAFQYQGANFNFGLDSQFASLNFMRLGMRENQPLPANQSRIYISFRGLGSDALNLSYTSQHYYDYKDIEFLNADYSFRLWNIGSVHFSALHFLNESQTTLQASLSIPLSFERTSLNLSASNIQEQSEGIMQIQRGLPVGTGYGYNLRVGTGDNQPRQGSISYQSNYGTYQLEGSQIKDQIAIRSNIRGGIALAGDTLLPSRHIDSSFAVVRIPGFSDVRVYAENQPVARTNSNGDALIPRLRPYERNQISIEQSDLPLDAKIKALDMEVSPYYRSGVVLNFPVTRTREAFFSLVQDNGTPLPVGAIVTNENGEHFPVGVRGEVFLTDLNVTNKLTAQWQNQICHFKIEVLENNDQMLEMGEVVCR